MDNSIQIYTDGAAKGNPGPGGWGSVIIINSYFSEYGGRHPHTTNNRMELLGILVPLEKWISDYSWLGENIEVTVYSDSRYAVESINQYMQNWVRHGWKTSGGKPVKNIDLMKRLFTAKKSCHLTVHWVKGHADNEKNNRCDVLARDASKNANKIDDLASN